MKISTELRHIINTRFSVYSDFRIPDKDINRTILAAAKKEPAISKSLLAAKSALKRFNFHNKILNRYGLNMDFDGDVCIRDFEKLEKIVSLPPKPPTRNEVLQTLAGLNTARAVEYLRTLGIDWS